MKKNKTGLFMILGLLFIIGFSILISSITGKEEIKLKEISFDQYEELFKEGSTGLTFVYYGSPNCGWCDSIKPHLFQLEKEEKVEFKYLVADYLTLENREYMIKTTSVFDEDGQKDVERMGTPALIAIINGKEHSNVGGYRELEDLRTFVKNAKSALKDE